MPRLIHIEQRDPFVWYGSDDLDYQTQNEVKPYKLHINVAENSLKKATETVIEMMHGVYCPIYKLKIVDPGIRDSCLQHQCDLYKNDASDKEEILAEIKEIERYKNKCQITIYIYNNENQYAVFFKELENRFKSLGIQPGDKMTFPDQPISTYISGRYDRYSDGGYIKPTANFSREEVSYIKEKQESCKFFNQLRQVLSEKSHGVPPAICFQLTDLHTTKGVDQGKDF
ncbi:hypothetical protein L3V82_10815 [Thiotrichales bacterium 19S3-7]|nr:hypothetical protein [Thiotrichales bacterium 19S3-7]MCF6802649.1 hypothetical protein [Thiotrichales bacterium 19S3-11]